MIVADVNLVAYLLIEGEHTASARAVWESDSDWRLPTLWAHEFLNILATLAKVDAAGLEEVTALWEKSQLLFSSQHEEVDKTRALELAIRNRISAYDSQYVALAQTLKVPLVTEDRQILGAFPELALSMHSFTGRNAGLSTP